MKLKYTAYYCVFIGFAVIALWIMLLAAGDLPEGKTALAFHIASEILMAVVCIFSGVAIIKQLPYSKRINIAGLGMMLYSVLNAAGYYGQQNEFLIMGMFIVLFVLTLTAFLPHLNSRNITEFDKK